MSPFICVWLSLTSSTLHYFYMTKTTFFQIRAEYCTTHRLRLPLKYITLTFDGTQTRLLRFSSRKSTSIILSRARGLKRNCLFEGGGGGGVKNNTILKLTCYPLFASCFRIIVQILTTSLDPDLSVLREINRQKLPKLYLQGYYIRFTIELSKETRKGSFPVSTCSEIADEKARAPSH